SAGGAVSLDGTNQLVALDDFSTTGDFTLVDAGGIDVIGIVNSVPGSIVILTNAGDLEVMGEITGVGVSLEPTGASGDIVLAGDVVGVTVELDAVGDILQTGGAVLAAAVFEAAAGGDIELESATNDFGGNVALEAGGATVSVVALNGLQLGATTFDPATTQLTLVAGTTLTFTQDVAAAGIDATATDIVVGGVLLDT